MAGDPLHSLDQFFDFEQLERDNNAFNSPIQYETAVHTVPSLGPDNAMDWQPTMPEPLYSEQTVPTSQPLLANLGHFDSIATLLQNVPVVPQIVVNSHATPPSIIYQQHPVPYQSEVDTSRQNTGQQNRPRRSSTVTRKPASATRKGPSNRLPVDARQMLEEEYAANPYPCSWEIDIIAHQANLDVKRVRNWFNNTRARKKPEITGTAVVAYTVLS